MKKLMLALFLVLVMAVSSWAAGTASVTGHDKIHVLREQQRVILTITWVDDTAGTTLAIDPKTYSITGWYLYTAETNPGGTAPTALYDITLVDADGADIAGGVLLNRSATVTELVNVGTSAAGYPVMRGSVTFTLSGNDVNNATGTLILTFVAN